MDKIPTTLPVLVLQDAVLFPGALIALSVDEDDAGRARERMRSATPLVAVVSARRDAGAEDGAEGEQASEPQDGSDEVLVELNDMGVAARIASVSEGDDGRPTIVLHGLKRIRLGEIKERDPQLVASVEAV